MTITKARSKPVPPKRRSRWRMALIVALAVAAVVIVFGAGWFANSWHRPSYSTRVDRAGYGVIDSVNPTGQFGCVKFDDGHRECTHFVVTTGQPVTQGESVYAAHEWTPSSDLLLIVPGNG